MAYTGFETSYPKLSESYATIRVTAADRVLARKVSNAKSSNNSAGLLYSTLYLSVGFSKPPIQSTVAPCII